MNEPFYNFSTVIDRVASEIDRLVLELFPGAKKTGASYRVGSESGDKGRSFSISTRSNNAGCYTDYADPSVKGNAIGLVALARNMSYQEAGKWLGQFLGVAPEVRLEMPQKRQPPKIKKEERKFQTARGEHIWGALDKRSIDFAASRGITKGTLDAHRCASSEDSIVMPHFDVNGNLVMIKTWSTDGQKRIMSNIDPVPTLFGKELCDPMKTGGRLLIAEGQWDSMTWQQLGYPAVSIPNGVSNKDWITEDWTFLNQFTEIFLSFDDDAVGREAEMVVKQRLGYERCKSIYLGGRYKDANEALQAHDEAFLHECFKLTEEAPIERIVKAESIKQKVRDRMNRTHQQGGVPFFLPKLPFEFRPNEITLWVGHTSHGKSTIVSNQVAYNAFHGERSFVASFEQATEMTMAAMLLQYTANPEIGHSTDYDEAYDDLASKVLFFDSMSRANPEELLATMKQAHKQLGVTHFVIDNIMTLETDRQDNTAQAAVADKFRVFVAQHPVHLHIVAHPRKPKDDTSKPPNTAEIRGAAEWGDMPHNIIAVYRDTAKAEKISSMRDENMPEEEILEFYNSIPDGKILVRKQRDSGHLPVVTYFFDGNTKRAYKDPENGAPYWVPSDMDGEAA